ncbi:unnamed protein product [Adineta steineri]|uniref:PDZ domain-containing protein n=1 Tax=Adineta steineri TaxID=433720 RepID=A0A818N6V5_9BILA|nr:unnamed protein product [Adineta steineri]CAF3600176.1 unnamed protein product [Adineta steineri]
MPTYGMGTRMVWWWFLILLILDFSQTDNPFSVGSSTGFYVDPFLEISSGVTTPANQKSSNSDSSCMSQGTLAGAIIGTLLLSAFIAFLTWMIYLRQKLQELHSYENHGKKHVRTLSKQQSMAPSSSNHKKQYTNDDAVDCKDNQLPVDVTDYKFGTFPFRQSQTPSVSGHYNHIDWLNRNQSSFRSVTMDKDVEMIDIELLNPTFCGLNFSITGNMRAGIFVKEILDKETSQGHMKLNSSDQLRPGDRIIALTICFESIVYEDALTILSYASPYPVILRVQRPLRSTKVNIVAEKHSLPTTVNKVKWRDDFEHYDNDTSHNHSSKEVNSSATLITDTKSNPTAIQHHSSSKTTRSNKSLSNNKGNKLKVSSNTLGTITKYSNVDVKDIQNKKSNQMIVTSKPIKKIPTPPISTNKTTMKSVTNAVISYLHYRGVNAGHVTDTTNNSEATFMPYYDSPYDYYGANISHSNLNKNINNNNSTSSESLTAVTSVYTIQLSSTKINPSVQQNVIPRRCHRRLSSPANILPMTVQTVDDKDISFQNIDTFV